MFHFLSVLTFLLQMLVVIFIACIASVVIAQQTPNVAQAVSLPFQASGLNIEDVPSFDERWGKLVSISSHCGRHNHRITHIFACVGDIDSRVQELRVNNSVMHR